MAVLEQRAGELLAEANLGGASHADAHAMLGVNPDASWEEIHERYREVTRLLHPDRGGDAKLMQLAQEAYEELKRLHGK